jgi:hypothetical protein
MSTADVRTKIAEFIAGAMVQQGEFTVERIELVYTPKGNNRREPLRTWHKHNEADRALFDPGRPFVDKLSGAILDLAEHQLETLGGTREQRFKIIIVQANKDRTVYPFTIAPEYDGDDAEIAKDEPDPTYSGLVREVMGQNRELHQRMENMMEQALRGMTRSIQQLADNNEKLQAALDRRDDERRNWLLKVEEAEGQKHQRELEGALVASEVERKELITKKAMGLLPVITSRLLERDDDDGKKGDKPSSELATTLVEFGVALTDENKAWLAMNLSVEQQAMLFEAKRLAERGGGIMLANIFHELVGTMKRSQLEGLINGLSDVAREKFGKAHTLAQAQASKSDEDDKKAG